jgi:hypothetical protein
MLQRDYIEEIIERFVNAVMDPIRRALLDHDEVACESVEHQIAELMSLSPDTAMSLSPESLCTMMLLSGIGDSIAGYCCWSMLRLADAYEAMGKQDLADLRRAQAEAIGRDFMYDTSVTPAEFEALDQEIREQIGE